MNDYKLSSTRTSEPYPDDLSESNYTLELEGLRELKRKGALTLERSTDSSNRKGINFLDTSTVNTSNNFVGARSPG